MALTCIAVGADGRGGPAAPPGGPQCVSLRAVFRPTSRAPRLISFLVQRSRR